jgi:hypothetical protein
MERSEFNLVLMPSELGGIGVFAACDIEKGVHVSDPKFAVRVLKKTEIPSMFHKYCIHKNDEEVYCPPRFDCMQIGWFINHSTDPNVVIVRKSTEQSGSVGDDLFMNPGAVSLVTCKKIFAGEEILIDYNNLNEPEHLKEAYYRA